MWWHKKFVSLDYLLTKDVTLFSIDAEYAYFVKTPKNIDIYNTEHHPFMFKAQQHYAEEVIVITNDKLLHLSKRLRKSSCSITFLLHSIRCGSTAVCQAFNSLPGWKVIAETGFPHKYLYDMRYKYGKSVTDVVKCEEFYDISEACIRVFIKDFDSKQRVLFKAIGLTDFCLIPFISDRFPQSHILTAHRNGMGTAKSSYQVFFDVTFNMTVPTRWNRYISYNLFWGDISRMVFMITNGMGEQFEQLVMNGYCADSFYLHYLRWITNSLQYLTYYRDANEEKLTCINFEDLVSNKQSTILQVSNQYSVPNHDTLMLLDYSLSVVGVHFVYSFPSVPQTDHYTFRFCRMLLKLSKSPAGFICHQTKTRSKSL